MYTLPFAQVSLPLPCFSLPSVSPCIQVSSFVDQSCQEEVFIQIAAQLVYNTKLALHAHLAIVQGTMNSLALVVICMTTLWYIMCIQFAANALNHKQTPAACTVRLYAIDYVCQQLDLPYTCLRLHS